MIKRRTCYWYDKGFTLMELMYVVIIVAILAALAYPSYMKQVLKAHRVVAKSSLLDIAAREEHFFFSNRAYTTDLTALGFDFPSSPFCFDKENAPIACTSSDAIYEVGAVINSVSSCGSSVCFLLTATPKHDQASDSCRSFSLNSSNERKSADAAEANCW